MSESDEEEFENEGSLRKRRLTIVNEKAAEALVALVKEEEVSAENARRKSHFYGNANRRVRKSSVFNSVALKIRPPKPRYFTL